MREQVVKFGSGGHLVGIVTEPAENQKSPNRPTVLLWNIGIHHRVGPNRVFVDLARALASSGFTCLRFDISGLGDSEASRTDSGTDKERASTDIRAAMQLMNERTHTPGAMLIAFCSGVDAAHAVATADSRVVGLICIEGYSYQTKGAIARLPLRVYDASRWERLLRNRLPKLFPPAILEPAEKPVNKEQVFVRELVSLNQFREDLRTMAARGTKLLFVYAGRNSGYTYQAQLQDALKDSKLLGTYDVAYYPEADHLFFIQEDRDKVIEDISRWSTLRFGGTLD